MSVYFDKMKIIDDALLARVRDGEMGDMGVIVLEHADSLGPDQEALAEYLRKAVTWPLPWLDAEEKLSEANVALARRNERLRGELTLARKTVACLEVENKKLNERLDQAIARVEELAFRLQVMHVVLSEREG